MEHGGASRAIAIGDEEPAIGVASGLGRFCALHLPHLVVAPVLLFFFVTFLHEMAHVAAVLLQGGVVTSFRIVPDGATFGAVSYERPETGPWSADLVAVAPYLLWSLSAAAVMAVAALPGRLHPALASTLFIWGYVAPVADIGWNLAAGVLGEGDLAVPGFLGPLVHGAGLLLLFVAYVIGFWVQRRLYGSEAIPLPGYLLATFVLGAGFGLAGLLGLCMLELG